MNTKPVEIKDLKSLNMCLMNVALHIPLRLSYIRTIKELPELIRDMELYLNKQLQPYNINDFSSINKLFNEVYLSL